MSNYESFDYRIRVPAKHAKSFEDALGLAPIVQIIDKIPSPVATPAQAVEINPTIPTAPVEQEPGWQNELLELGTTIDDMRLKLEQGDTDVANAFNGFGKYMLPILYSHGYKEFREDFPSAVIGIFDRSYNAYSVLPVRPIKKRAKGSGPYNRLDNNLTPRDIRMIIKGFGLDGTNHTSDEIATSEGILKAKPAIVSAKNHLLWAMTPDYVSDVVRIRL